MLILINFCLVVFLLVISFQDFKQREISWLLIPFTFLALFLDATYFITSDLIIKNTLLNLAFVTVQLLLLTLYMSIKNKKITNILHQHLGLGDLLFFVVLCVAFSPINFIVFYLFSMMTTLVGYIAYAVIFPKKNLKEIPLAGAMASILVVTILINTLTRHMNFYDDNFLLNIINN